MQTNQKIKSVENRVDRTTYTGKFKDFQTFGESYKGKKYQELERKSYSEYQNFLYKRAMFGLKMYPQDEIKSMHWQKRKRIQKVHKRTQEELNIWKQNKIIAMTNKIFSLFTHSSGAQELLDIYSEPDPKFICRASFKDLGITKDDIVERLLYKGILPHDFHTVTQQP